MERDESQNDQINFTFHSPRSPSPVKPKKHDKISSTNKIMTPKPLINIQKSDLSHSDNLIKNHKINELKEENKSLNSDENEDNQKQLSDASSKSKSLKILDSPVNHHKKRETLKPNDKNSSFRDVSTIKKCKF